MATLRCQSRTHAYPVEIDAGAVAGGSVAAAVRALSADRAFVLTDPTVRALHGSSLEKGSGGVAFQTLEIPPGEAAKTFAEAARVARELVRLSARRDAVLVALGGGSVGDLAGFTASIYMRGIRWICVPTTLLAQADSCVGGKTAVNLPEGKNLLGAFWPPAACVVDPAMLLTLPSRDYVSGLAEIVKYGAVCDAELLSDIERHADALLSRDLPLLADVIRRCLRIKIALVEADERDEGPRQLLNFGHTFGHALEAAGSFEALSHGEAVAIGMGLESRLAGRLGLLDDPSTPDRIAQVLARLGLPVAADPATLRGALSFLAADKKARGTGLTLAFPPRAGEGRIVRDLDPAEASRA